LWSQKVAYNRRNNLPLRVNIASQPNVIQFNTKIRVDQPQHWSCHWRFRRGDNKLRYPIIHLGIEPEALERTVNWDVPTVHCT
ncbi:hypothetical protein FRC01_014588, partial [Tulasnella sp. 417]